MSPSPCLSPIFIQSPFFVNKQLDSHSGKRGWAKVYYPCSLVSNQMYHRIDGILLASSKFGQRRLVMKNTQGIGSNRKRRLFLNTVFIRLTALGAFRIFRPCEWALIRGGRLFEAGRLFKFSLFSASVVCLFYNKTVNANNKTRKSNKARFL